MRGLQGIADQRVTGCVAGSRARRLSLRPLLCSASPLTLRSLHFGDQTIYVIDASGQAKQQPDKCRYR